MAQPITDIIPKTPSLEEQWDELKSRLLADQDSIEALLRLVGAAREAEILPCLTGLLEQKNSVLTLLIQEMNQDGVKQAINNLEQLAALWGNIHQDTVHSMLGAVNQGLERMGQNKEADSAGGMGVVQLWRYLKNPDIAYGVKALFTFLEGFGKSLASQK